MALSLLLAAASLAPATARADEIFTVRGVEVDATAGNVVEAREIALAEGQRQAANRLFERLVPAEYLVQVPPLGSGTLDELVRDVSVARERRSDVRYLAELTVGFRPESVRRLLRDVGVPFAETPGQAILVLPLYGPRGQGVLWNDENPWRDFWANRQGSGGLVPFVAPIGDLSDIVAVDAAAAENGDYENFAAIALRYGAEQVIVARATPGDNPTVLRIQSTRYSPDSPPVSQADEITHQPGEDQADMFERAALRIEEPIQNEWRRANLLRFDSQAKLLAEVPLSSLEDWVTVRDRLAGTASVLSVTPRRLSRSQATIELSYVGDEAQLIRALALSNLDLRRKPATAVWDAGQATAPAPWSGTAPGSGSLGASSPLSASGSLGASSALGTSSTLGVSRSPGAATSGPSPRPPSAGPAASHEIIRRDLAPAAPVGGSG